MKLINYLKSRLSMKYDITKHIAPALPVLGRGTECVKLLASQVSPDMREAIIPMMFPVISAYLSGTKFQYPDRTWKEPCGILAHLVADSGMGKGQLSGVIEAVMRKFRVHDQEQLQQLVEWQRQVKSKGSSKDKPVRPNVCFWFPPSDVTNAAFIQNAMDCEQQGEHASFYNMPEVEMADRMCGGHKQVSQTIRNIYDLQRAGALRATADGVTGNPTLRVNMTLSSTPFSARRFYKNELYNGTFGRVIFSYKARNDRSGRIPRQGTYDEEFLRQLDKYIVRLEACKGKFIIPKLNKLIDRLAADMATIADLTDDDVLWDMSKRSLVSAWKCGCVLYVLNAQAWTVNMENLVEWLVYHDLWSKMRVFGDLLKEGDLSTEAATKSGPKNMLDSLPDTFNIAQLEALRVAMNKDKDASHQLSVWGNRGFITRSAQTGLYSKTQEYLNRNK